MAVTARSPWVLATSWGQTVQARRGRRLEGRRGYAQKEVGWKVMGLNVSTGKFFHLQNMSTFYPLLYNVKFMLGRDVFLGCFPHTCEAWALLTKEMHLGNAKLLLIEFKICPKLSLFKNVDAASCKNKGYFSSSTFILVWIRKLLGNAGSHEESIEHGTYLSNAHRANLWSTTTIITEFYFCLFWRICFANFVMQDSSIRLIRNANFVKLFRPSEKIASAFFW